jgi:WD40 repeat protein
MPKNLSSITDRMPFPPSRISHHARRIAYCVLRVPHFTQYATRNTLVLMTIAIVFTGSQSRAEDKITYQDHILPLVEANCSKCHNADKKKADLDLTSYQGALKGSGSGAVLVSGNLDGSKLWKAITHAEEPNMPPNRPRLDDKDLDLFKKWILGGLLETVNGKAIAATAPGVDLTLKADAVGKPDGPPPMPGELPAVPVVHTTHLNAITGLASSPWAPLIAVAGQKQILLFNAESRDLLGILPFSEGQPADVKFSRSGQLLLANGGRGARSGRVILWDVLTGKRMTTLGDDYDTILTADIRPDQSQVAVGSPSRLVKIFSTKTGELQHKIKKHTDWVTAVAFSPNGQMLATADRNGGISIWDPDNAQELFTLAGHKSYVTALSWRGDSKLLASSSEDGTVKLWEMQEGKQFKSWNAHNSGALCVTYAHDGRLVSCGRDNNVTLWDANGGKIRSITSTNDIPLRVTFSHDDSTIFASDFSGHITAYSTKEGKLLGELDANPAPPPEKAAPAKRVASSH